MSDLAVGNRRFVWRRRRSLWRGPSRLFCFIDRSARSLRAMIARLRDGSPN